MAEKVFPISQERLEEIIKNIRHPFIFMMKKQSEPICAASKRRLTGHLSSENILR